MVVSKLQRLGTVAQHLHQVVTKTNQRPAASGLAAHTRLLVRTRLPAGIRRRLGRIVRRRLGVEMGRDMIRVLGLDWGPLGFGVGSWVSSGMGAAKRAWEDWG